MSVDETHCEYLEKVEIPLLNRKIKDLEAERLNERESTKIFSDALNEERLRHGATERKLERAVEALRFYADKQSWLNSSDLKIDDHYSCYEGNDGIKDIWTSVGGKRAKKTLEEIEKGE